MEAADQRCKELGGEDPVILYESGERHTNPDGTAVQKGPPNRLTNEQLMDMWVYDDFIGPRGGEKVMKGHVKEVLPDQSVRVAFPDGKQKHYDYEEFMDKVSQQDEPDGTTWKFDTIDGHRTNPDNPKELQVLIKWSGPHQPTWEPMETIKECDPVTLAAYAHDNHLDNQPQWKWAKRYYKTRQRWQRLVKQTTS